MRTAPAFTITRWEPTRPRMRRSSARATDPIKSCGPRSLKTGDTELYYQDVAAQGPIRPVVNDVPARFLGDVGGDHLYLRTNWNAPKGRILAVDLKNPVRERWQQVVPETGFAIESLTVGGGKLLVNYLENAS